jgi:hypothetical protein
MLLSIASCDILGLDGGREPAFLGDSGIAATVIVPDTVTHDVEFGVQISFYGSSSCTKYDDTEVEALSGGVTLRPYVTESGGTCTSDLQHFQETVSVILTAPGINQVRVVGRFGQGDTTIVRETFVR